MGRQVQTVGTTSRREGKLQRVPPRSERHWLRVRDRKEDPTTKFWDRVRLVCTAMLVCVIGGSSFLLGEIYHINPAWLFLSWNSIWLLVSVGKRFRIHFKKPEFAAFFLLWMAVHGTVVVMLMRWVHMLYWVPLMGLELFVGFLSADLLFGIRPDRKAD